MWVQKKGSHWGKTEMISLAQNSFWSVFCAPSGRKASPYQTCDLVLTSVMALIPCHIPCHCHEFLLFRKWAWILCAVLYFASVIAWGRWILTEQRTALSSGLKATAWVFSSTFSFKVIHGFWFTRVMMVLKKVTSSCYCSHYFKLVVWSYSM